MGVHPGWNLRAGDEVAPGRAVLRRLGGGLRSEVYLVTEDARACAAVAKVLRPDVLGDPRAWRALEREARALSSHAHPNIVRVFDAILEGPRPHLLLEYLEGPTLGSLLKHNGPLSIEQTLPMGLALAGALHFMHATGWVHLDVKPSNVIMGSSAVLIDLSVARKVERAAKITGRVGTTGTMAPEQLEPAARGPVGPPADIWGLGIVLKRALGDKDDRIPPDLVRLANRCLHPDQVDRPTAAEVILALEPMISLLPARPILGRRRPRLVAR